MARNFSKEVTIFVAVAVTVAFLLASIIPIIGPGVLAYYSGRLQYFLDIITNFEVTLTILISQLIITLAVWLFWQLTPIIIVILLINAMIAITIFFIGLKMEISDQAKGITI